MPIRVSITHLNQTESGAEYHYLDLSWPHPRPVRTFPKRNLFFQPNIFGGD